MEQNKDDLRQKMMEKREEQESYSADNRKVEAVDGYGNPTSLQTLQRPIMQPAMAWMAYPFSWVGILAVALGCDRKNTYVKHHLNNALVCAMISTVSLIVMSLLNAWALWIQVRSLWSLETPVSVIVLKMFCALFGICAIYAVIMMFIGWIAALRGRTMNLPLISKVRIFK